MAKCSSCAGSTRSYDFVARVMSYRLQ